MTRAQRPAMLSDAGELLDQSLRVYRAQFWTLAGIVACGYLPWVLVQILVLGLPDWYNVATRLNVLSSHFDALSLTISSDHSLQLIGLLLFQQLLLFPIIGGALIAACNPAGDRASSIGAAYRAALRRAGPLALAAAAPAIYEIAALLIGQRLAIPESLEGGALGYGWGWSSELIQPIWLLAALALGGIAILLCLSAQAVVLDGVPVLLAWRQSRAIVLGSVWRVLATLIVMGTLELILTRGASLLLLGGMLLQFWRIGWVGVYIELICVVVGWVVAMPLVAIGLTLIYAQPRMHAASERLGGELAS